MGEVDDAIDELSHAHAAIEAYGDVFEELQAWALALPGWMTHEGERWGTARLDRAAKRVADISGRVDASKLLQALACCKVEAENARDAA